MIITFGSLNVIADQFMTRDALFDPRIVDSFDVEVNEAFRLPREAKLIEKLRRGIVARWGVGYENLIPSTHVSGMDRMAERLVREPCVSNIIEFPGGRIKAITPYAILIRILAG